MTTCLQGKTCGGEGGGCPDIHDGNATLVHFICQSGTVTLMLLQHEQRKIKRKQIQRRLSQFERSIICHYETALRLSHPPAPYLWHSYLYGCHTFSPSSGPCHRSSSWGEAGFEGRGVSHMHVWHIYVQTYRKRWWVGSTWVQLWEGVGNGLLWGVATEPLVTRCTKPSNLIFSPVLRLNTTIK